jgi:hypothetical protein
MIYGICIDPTGDLIKGKIYKLHIQNKDFCNTKMIKKDGKTLYGDGYFRWRFKEIIIIGEEN